MIPSMLKIFFNPSFLLTLGVVLWGGQTCFYVTESSAFRNQLLYFRQDDWVTLCTPLIERLKSATFEKLPEVTSLALAFYFILFLLVYLLLTSFSSSSRQMLRKFSGSGN